MAIWYDKTWHSKLYDKRVELVAKGLKLNKFPHPESKLSSRCKYGVITSQLSRYNVACTQTRDFASASVELYKAYVEKGYKIRKIDYYFERFIHNRMRGIRPDHIKRLYDKRQRCSHG